MVRCLGLLGLWGCMGNAPEVEVAPRELPSPTFVDMPQRLVGIGDVHGDVKMARKVLKKVGAIDSEDQWIGGNLVVVQTGDQLDRGDTERDILDLYEKLGESAHAAGGAFYPLLGNHEVMNAELDFRYVSDGGWADFEDVAWDASDPLYESYPTEHRGRVAAFRPGGVYSSLFANRNVIMVVGDTVFVHGGVLWDHVEFGLEKINRQTQKWLRDEREQPDILDGDDSPIWSRHYSDEPDLVDCSHLAKTLAAIPAKRMVVGHTVQSVVNGACDDQVWRVDIGMADYYGGTWGAVEIIGELVRPLP